MNMEAAIQSSELAMGSDPREAKFGYFAGGSFVMDSVRVFKWFSDVNAMVMHLVEAEPAVFELSGEEAGLVRTKLSEALEGVDLGSLTEELRRQVNDITKDFLTVEWWGDFDELKDGETIFAETIRSDFREAEESDKKGALSDFELDGFVEFMKEYGV